MLYIPADIEADGLELEEITKIHVLTLNWNGTIISTNNYDKMRGVVQREDVTLIGHNFVQYDVPVLEKLLGVKVQCQIFDTLALSWALYPKRGKHGLGDWGEEFGVPKPEVENWIDLPYETYKTRCEEDVKIQTLLWEKARADLTSLYGEEESVMYSYIRYLTFKMEMVRMQSKHPFKLDIPKLKENLNFLEKLKDEKIEALKSVMPTVGVKSKRNPPKNPYKKDGELSATGLKWKRLTEEHNLPFEHNEPITVVKDYEEANPQSPQQVKDWLFGLGWKPFIYTEGVNGKVPQIYNEDKEICDSVKVLGDVVLPLEGLGRLKHRIGLLNGMLRDVKDGYITQSISGFTSTLRVKHKFLVNLPKPKVEYGELIRGVLTCDDGYEVVGSDLSSLEDRTKMHYIHDYDPDYVAEMSHPDYDSHTSLAVFAKGMSSEEAEEYQRIKNTDTVSPSEEKEFKRLDVVRHLYKTANYSCVYGVGATKLSKTLDITRKEAEAIINAYWEKNWSVKAFAQSCETKESHGYTWIKNPVNRYWYELRSDKDRFSAVNQSTGSFIFDMWVREVMNQMDRLTLQKHDELAFIVKKGYREAIIPIIEGAIETVNKKLQLNRNMGCDVQFGNNYAQVH